MIQLSAYVLILHKMYPAEQIYFRTQNVVSLLVRTRCGSYDFHKSTPFLWRLNTSLVTEDTT